MHIAVSCYVSSSSVRLLFIKWLTQQSQRHHLKLAMTQSMNLAFYFLLIPALYMGEEGTNHCKSRFISQETKSFSRLYIPSPAFHWETKFITE